TTYRNEYVLGLEKASLLTLPVPDARSLASLSAIVDHNNHFDRKRDLSPMMAFLRKNIKHVVYVQKYNRTYTQILRDLPVGNGYPTLATFGQSITPNLHELAEQFADLDNFYVASDVSADGWNWDMQGHPNDYVRKAELLYYSSRSLNGLQWNGADRGV